MTMNYKKLTLFFLCVVSIHAYAQRKDSNLELGKKRYQSGDYKGAVASFTKSIQSNPSNAIAYYNRSQAEVELQEYDAALRDARKFQQLEPQDIDGINQVSYLLEVTEDFKGLIDWSNQMLNSSDNEVVSNAHYYLGVAYNGLKDYDKALPELTKVLAAKPKDVDALFARGCVYVNLNKYDEAINDLTLHLSLDNKHVNAYFWRALVLSFVKKPVESLIDLNTAIDVDSTLSYLYDLRGDIKITLADSLGGRADYDKAIALNSEPDYDLFYKRAMLAYRQFDDNDDALIYLNKVISGAPNDYPDTYTARGYIYNDQNLFSEANADFEKYHQLDSADTHVYLQWALAKQGLKQHEEAINMVKRFLKTENLNEGALVFAHYTLAKSMYELADFSNAIEEFNKAMSINSNFGELHYWLAKTLNQLKMIDEACSHFEKAYELGHEDARDELIATCGFNEDAFEEDEQ